MPNEPSNLVPSRPPGLVDLLDRILDKGLVIAGDIKVSLTNIELLTLQIRLIICSIDKAEQIGINWWRSDPNLTTNVPPKAQIEEAPGESSEAPEPLTQPAERQPAIPTNVAGPANATPSRPRSRTNVPRKAQNQHVPERNS